MKKQKQSGFISLFLILNISIASIFYMYLSSERVFEYIQIRDEFYKNRSMTRDVSTCADMFINNIIRSDFNLDIVNGLFDFRRNLDISDMYTCHIKDVSLIYDFDSIDKIIFKIENRPFEYNFDNGFVYFKKPWELF